MANKSFTGMAKGRIVEVRFATSGKVSWVKVGPGDRVKKGQALAGLDKTIAQQRLDKELADYEEVRAGFEIFNLKHKEEVNDENKYRKKQVQADLDAAVMAVEMAKYALDQLTMVTPVKGVVIDDSELVPGLYVTPASAPIKILDQNNLYFSFKVNQEQVAEFRQAKEVKVEIDDLDLVIEGKTVPAFLPTKGKPPRFEIRVELNKAEDLLPGMTGKVIIL